MEQQVAERAVPPPQMRKKKKKSVPWLREKGKRDLLSESFSSGELHRRVAAGSSWAEGGRGRPRKVSSPPQWQGIGETLVWDGSVWNEPVATSTVNMGTDDSRAAFLLTLHPLDDCKTPKLSVTQHDEWAETLNVVEAECSAGLRHNSLTSEMGAQLRSEQIHNLTQWILRFVILIWVISIISTLEKSNPRLSEFRELT